MTKRTEQEALFRGDVDDFRVEIVKKGGLLAAAIAADFPNAEPVSKAINGVNDVVSHYDLEGKWVTSCVSDAEYVTTREIRSVSIFPYLFKM